MLHLQRCQPCYLSRQVASPGYVKHDPAEAAARADAEWRFWLRVRKTDTCWLWQGKIGKDGYGRLSWEGADQAAHRVAFRLVTGRYIPKGMELDHLCRVRHCVNPLHLEIVTRAENVRRGLMGVMRQPRTSRSRVPRTACNSGHPYPPDQEPTPGRGMVCRVCADLRRERHRAKAS